MSVLIIDPPTVVSGPWSAGAHDLHWHSSENENRISEFLTVVCGPWNAF